MIAGASLAFSIQQRTINTSLRVPEHSANHASSRVGSDRRSHWRRTLYLMRNISSEAQNIN
jgi:hypothetical protein